MDKKSREQFEIRTHKRLIDIYDPTPQTVDALMKLELAAGVDVEIKAVIGILGKKLGMTQIFIEGGVAVPVTVIEAGPCSVIQVKTREKDGYEAVKVGFSEIRKEKKVNKPMSGVFKKAGAKPYRLTKEFKMGDLKVGRFRYRRRICQGRYRKGLGSLQRQGVSGSHEKAQLQGWSGLTRFHVQSCAGFHRCKFLSLKSMEEQETSRAYGIRRGDGE